MQAKRSYSATVLRVLDGDTLDVELDLGFRIFSVQRLRLLGIDCPESASEDGLKAYAFTHSWCNTRLLRVETEKMDSFGRWLANVFDLETGESLGQALLNASLASPWKRG